jgi:hypothetical protein
MAIEGVKDERLNEIGRTIEHAASVLDEVFDTAVRALTVLEWRKARTSRSRVARQSPGEDGFSRLLGISMRRAVHKIDVSAKRAESMVKKAERAVEALEERCSSRLLRGAGAPKPRHSDDLKALRAFCDQLHDFAESISHLPEMHYLDPEAIPAMSVSALSELLRDIARHAHYMQEEYEGVVMAHSGMWLEDRENAKD